MNIRVFVVLLFLAGAAAACDSSWTQNRDNFNMNLFYESDFGGSDCVPLNLNATFNKIRCCGAVANQVAGITAKSSLPIVSKAFIVSSNFTFIAASVSHAYMGLVNVKDAADAQTVNVTSPKMLIGMTMERGSASITLYCNGSVKGGVDGGIGYSANYVHVQRFRRASGDTKIYPEFWNGTGWVTGSNYCDIIPSEFDNAGYSAVWSFKDDDTSKCADLNSMSAVSNFTDYGSFLVVNNNSYPLDDCVLTNVADYWGGIYPYQYTTDGAGLTPTAALKYGCGFSESYGYYSLVAIETECPGYSLKSDDVLFYSKNESSLLAVVNVGAATPTSSTTSTTTTTTTLPATFSVSNIATQPAGTVAGGVFNVFIRTEKAGAKYVVDDCRITLAGMEGGETADSVSFAYTLAGNTYGTSHLTDLISDAKWVYKNKQTVYVNSSTPPGDYEVIIECVKGGETETGYTTIKVSGAAGSSLAWVGALPVSVAKSTSSPFSVVYKNGTGGLLSGATCDYKDNFGRSVSFDIQPSKNYRGYVFFDAEGFVNFNVTCQVADFDDATVSGSLTVTGASCFNGVMDGAELGIDCGGSCTPCGGGDTGGEGCGLKYDECNVNSDCCSGWCGLDANGDKVCLSPSCEDGIKNQGEAQIDCGGDNCPPCAACLYDNDCGADGSQLCNVTRGYQCDYLRCGTDADCPILSNWYVAGQGVISRQLFCDPNRLLCSVESRNTINQTTLFYAMDIYGSTGFMANRSGTIWYTLNCDAGNNGFRVVTNASTKTYYSFAASPYSPSLPFDQYLRAFADGKIGADKSGLIPELCGSLNGYGGIPISSNSVVARINFKSCSGYMCYNRLVDVIAYRQGLKNDLGIDFRTFTGSEREYQFNATNRSIYLQVKNTQSDAYLNATSEYIVNAAFNLSQITGSKNFLDVFYYRVTTEYGEVLEDRHGDLFWMPIKWDDKTKWFAFNFTFQSYMLWILLALIVVGLVYANYRLQENRIRPRY